MKRIRDDIGILPLAGVIALVLFWGFTSSPVGY